MIYTPIYTWILEEVLTSSLSINMIYCCIQRRLLSGNCAPCNPVLEPLAGCGGPALGRGSHGLSQVESLALGTFAAIPHSWVSLGHLLAWSFPALGSGLQQRKDEGNQLLKALFGFIWTLKGQKQTLGSPSPAQHLTKLTSILGWLVSLANHLLCSPSEQSSIIHSAQSL